MLYRNILVVSLVWGIFSTLGLETFGQEVLYDNRPDQMSDWNSFRPEVQTRMGKTRIGEMPENMSFSRITLDGAKMGRFNTFLGVDVDAPGMRLGNYKRSEPLLPTDFLSEKPAAGKKDRPSANVPIERQETAPQSMPLRQHPSFFEHPDVLQAEVPGDTLRTPAEQRWFRDIGRRPGLGDRQAGGAAGSQGGEAFVVGDSPSSAGAPTDPATVPDARLQAAQTRQALAAEQARLRQRFEQKLEGMLLSTPKVQFLSPVQVSFQNGVVTVRGVVPDQTHKVTAGNILLGDPAVKQVNNLISIVPTDPGSLPAPIEPK